MLKIENKQKIFQILSNMHLYVIVFHYPVCPVSWLNSITLKWGRICNPVVSGVSPGTYLSLKKKKNTKNLNEIIYQFCTFPLPGGQAGSKPPLSMMSPAGNKLQRNTATVSPLDHVTSPTNGVTSIGANAALNASRTSSFAAALRKLANQAKDAPGMDSLVLLYFFKTLSLYKRHTF